MSIKSFASGLAALAILGACATATPYQAAQNSSGGYTDQQIESNRWNISFAGNSLTDRKTVETYLLYRAAELTSQQGYSYFEVVQRETDADSRFIGTGFYDPFYPGFYPRYAFYGPYSYRHARHYRHRAALYGYYDPFWGRSQEFREVVRYEATAEIMMHQGEKPEGGQYFSAEDVLVNLSGSIVLPEGL